MRINAVRSGGPVHGPYHQKLAQVLAELGRSRLASNTNQLAKSANMGTFPPSMVMVLTAEKAPTVGAWKRTGDVTMCRIITCNTTGSEMRALFNRAAPEAVQLLSRGSPKAGFLVKPAFKCPVIA